MFIEEKKLQHWVNLFYGYGSWSARFWFIGYEESGGNSPQEVAEKFNYFSKEHSSVSSGTLCDIRKLYRQLTVTEGDRKGELFTNRHEYRFGPNAIQHRIWKNLIAFERGYQNEKLPDLINYQCQKLALPDLAQEALISLYPLPSPHNHAWYYSWLNLPQVDYLKSREHYEAHVYEARIQTILSNVRAHQPEVVLMYGMNNINSLKESVSSFFPQAKFALSKAVKQQIPPCHRAEVNGTILLITTQIPALRHNRIETGFNWETFGRLCRG